MAMFGSTEMTGKRCREKHHVTKPKLFAKSFGFWLGVAGGFVFSQSHSHHTKTVISCVITLPNGHVWIDRNDGKTMQRETPRHQTKTLCEEFWVLAGCRRWFCVQPEPLTPHQNCHLVRDHTPKWPCLDRQK